MTSNNLCPECGSDDLHSASLGGRAAISCCDCEHIWLVCSACTGSGKDTTEDGEVGADACRECRGAGNPKHYLSSTTTH